MNPSQIKTSEAICDAQQDCAALAGASEGAAPKSAGPSGSLRCDGVVGLRVAAAEALLDRADQMLRRADLLLNGWEHARDWRNDLIDYRRQMETETVRQPEPNAEISHDRERKI